MLSRLIKGKSTFSVSDWEKSHQARQKLLKRFGVHPYVLNQKSDTIDVNSTYLSKGAVWQSSTKIGAEDNVTKFNFPMGLNYPSQVSTKLSGGMTQNFSNTAAGAVRDSVDKNGMKN